MENDDIMRLSDEALCTWRGGEAARDLIDECEAVLEGRYVDQLLERGASVPVWAWTNLIAHGSERALHRSILSAHDRREGAWFGARALAAGEALRIEHLFGDLRGLQSSVLVPLELRLAANPAVESWMPYEWVSAVLTAMDHGEDSQGVEP